MSHFDFVIEENVKSDRGSNSLNGASYHMKSTHTSKNEYAVNTFNDT